MFNVEIMYPSLQLIDSILDYKDMSLAFEFN